MSIFHFPRINVKGMFIINVGTCNNDDYSGCQFPQGSTYAGQPVRQFDSINVKAITYGLSDADWITWAQKPFGVYAPPQSPPPPCPQTTAAPKFSKSEKESDSPGQAAAIAPKAQVQGTTTPGQPANTKVLNAEWNYYGDMGLTMQNVKVVGITDPNNNIPAALKQQISQSVLSFNNRPDSTGRSTGIITDINAEDVNSSQFFADNLTLAYNNTALFSGDPSKGMIRWINFQRNVTLGGSNGGAGTFQMAVPLSQLQGQPILQAFPTTSPEGNALIGLVFRYTIFRGLQEISVYKYPNNDDWMNKMMALYATKGLNPHNSELQGTVAPWYEGEPASCPVGRVLYASPNAQPLCNPFYKPGHSNGTGFFLCVAIINVNSTANTVSIDLSEALPEHYEGNYDPFVTGNNPKWDIGNLTLYIRANGTDTAIGTLPYAPTDTCDSQGWIYDFTYDSSLASSIADGLFVIKSDTNGELMLESQYFIVSDQSGVYAEMGATTTTVSQFRNEGADLVPISFNVYDRGQPVSGTDGTLDLYWYDTTPNQDSGNMPANLLTQNYVPGTPISFPVSFAGNVLITAVLAGSAKPDVYGNFNNVAQPMITIRILPYNDYSQYYVDPSAPEPVGNASLTFDVVYQEVFQVYYLLFPAMSERIALNDPQEWSDAEMAGRLMQRTSLEFWGTALQMPRTTDLSQCRRTLLTAWCLKFFQTT